MRLIKSALGLLLAGSLSGCFVGSDGDVGAQEQLLRGHIPLSSYSAEVVGVRVVTNGRTVATARTDAAGNFDLRVPEGHNYAFEIVTKSGTHPLLTGPIHSDTPMTFDVCDPGEDFDLGTIDPFDFEEIDGDEVPWSSLCWPSPWAGGYELEPPSLVASARLAQLLGWRKLRAPLSPRERPIEKANRGSAPIPGQPSHRHRRGRPA